METEQNEAPQRYWLIEQPDLDVDDDHKIIHTTDLDVYPDAIILGEYELVEPVFRRREFELELRRIEAYLPHVVTCTPPSAQPIVSVADREIKSAIQALRDIASRRPATHAHASKNAQKPTINPSTETEKL